MTVYLFNVGQGDHLLLELPNGKYGLLDFHYDKSVNVNDEPPALTFLKRKHTPENPVVLSFLCISHPHRDHTKGITKVLSWIIDNKIELERLWLYPGINETDARIALENAIRTLEKIVIENRASGIQVAPEGLPNNSQIFRLREDLEAVWKFVQEWGHSPSLIQGVTRIDVKDGIEVCALAPLTAQIQAANQEILEQIFLWRNVGPLHFGDRNLVSSIIRLTFGEHQLLFGGDCGLKTWEQSLEEFGRMHQNGGGPCGPDYRASFIKASHHGSAGSSSVDFWEQVLRRDGAISVVGISAGKGQRHPSQTTVEHVNTAVQEKGCLAEVFTTNLCNKCSLGRDVPREDISWLGKKRKKQIDKASRNALLLDAPHAQSRLADDAADDPTNEALKELSPVPVRKKRSSPKQVGAYIFRFSSNSRVVETRKAIIPCEETRACLFGYVGKERFPKCAK